MQKAANKIIIPFTTSFILIIDPKNPTTPPIKV